MHRPAVEFSLPRKTMFRTMESRDLCLWPVFLTVLIGLLSPIQCSADSYRLFDDLFSAYNPDVRPSRNATHPTSVRVGLSLIQIRKLDTENGVLDLLLWVDNEWSDPHLQWDPGAYGGINDLRVPADVIWRPDIVIFNLVAPETELHSQSRALVSADGAVFLSRSLRTKTSCEFHPTASEHMCRIKLLSWAYDGFKIDLNLRTEKIDLSNYIYNKNWKLISTNATRNVAFYTCCPEPFPDVVFDLTLARRDNPKSQTQNHASPLSSSSHRLVYLLSVVVYFVISYGFGVSKW